LLEGFDVKLQKVYLPKVEKVDTVICNHIQMIEGANQEESKAWV